MKKHKGQVIVEFALILPFFLLMLYGIIYSGMMFHDYSTLSNIARASAREAAISGAPLDSATNRYKTVEDNYKSQIESLLTSFYVVQDKNNPIIIEPATEDSIRSTIIMKVNVSGYFLDMILPPTFGVQYYMRKEPTGSSSSG